MQKADKQALGQTESTVCRDNARRADTDTGITPHLSLGSHNPL